MFSPFTDFWIFTNDSEFTDSHVKNYQKEINEEFLKVYNYCIRKGYSAKLFTRTKDNKFKFPDFTNIDEEIRSSRFDGSVYVQTITEIIRKVNSGKKKLVISDFDGTLVLSDYPNSEESLFKDKIHTYLYDNYRNQILLVVTGRDTLTPDQVETIKQQYHFMDVYVIWNNWNVGQSSRALKEYFCKFFETYDIEYAFAEDRKDVMEHLFPNTYDKYFNDDLGIYFKDEA